MSNLINLLGLKSILVTIIIVSACEGCLPLREKIINSWEISLGVRKSNGNTRHQIPNASHDFIFISCLLTFSNIFDFCYAEFEIIRENINAKIKTTDLRGSPINWLRPRKEGEQFYYGEVRKESPNRVCRSVYI